MVMIGIDPHKATRTAVGIDNRETVLAERLVSASPTSVDEGGRSSVPGGLTLVYVVDLAVHAWRPPAGRGLDPRSGPEGTSGCG
jgi:hypothetical protein